MEQTAYKVTIDRDEANFITRIKVIDLLNDRQIESTINTSLDLYPDTAEEYTIMSMIDTLRYAYIEEAATVYYANHARS